MEEALTETEVVKLPNTPTGHGQKKEVYSTLNPLLFLVKLSTRFLEPKEREILKYILKLCKQA